MPKTGHNRKALYEPVHGLSSATLPAQGHCRSRSRMMRHHFAMCACAIPSKAWWPRLTRLIAGDRQQWLDKGLAHGANIIVDALPAESANLTQW